MDKRAPGVLRKKKPKKKKQKKKQKQKTATTTLKASSTRDTSHIVFRGRIRNVLVLALYALQIVQVERLSCNLCAISYDRSRFILSPAPQRNATVLISTRSPRLQTVTGVRLSRYSCLVIPEGRPTIRQNTARLV